MRKIHVEREMSMIGYTSPSMSIDTLMDHHSQARQRDVVAMGHRAAVDPVGQDGRKLPPSSPAAFHEDRQLRVSDTNSHPSQRGNPTMYPVRILQG